MGRKRNRFFSLWCSFAFDRCNKGSWATSASGHSASDHASILCDCYRDCRPCIVWLAVFREAAGAGEPWTSLPLRLSELSHEIDSHRRNTIDRPCCRARHAAESSLEPSYARNEALRTSRLVPIGYLLICCLVPMNAATDSTNFKE